jgi:prolyl 4-hydroxylase
MNASLAPTARRLAEAGRVDEGLGVLRQAQADGQADAFLTEGLWRLEGRLIPRDLTSGRGLIARAAEEGHVDAARILSALVARGIGAPPDWRASLAILKDWSARDPIAARQLELISCMDDDDDGVEAAFEAKVRSESPRIVRIEQFLSSGECAFLIECAEPRMKRSTVFNRVEQRFVEDPFRTSDAAAFPVIFQSPFICAINGRIARATGTATECGEPLQILRYRPAQEYRPHNDSSAEMENPRAITAIAWLNDDFEGGQTCFDQLGLSESPRAGDLLFFENVRPDGSPDPRSRHAGLPVIDGTKYLASRWIRMRAWNEHGLGVKALLSEQS